MRVTIAKGQTLEQALEQNNIILDKPCNGRGTCGRCAVWVDKIGRVKSCQFRLPGTYEVHLQNTIQFQTVMEGQEVLPREAGLLQAQRCQIAVDIGTTTVALVGYGYGKKVLRSFVNPQRCMGADVMSRIQMANSGHAQRLKQIIEEQLFDKIEEIISELFPIQTAGQLQQPVNCNVAVAANTTMGHILCGFSCEGLAGAPFHPVSLETQKLQWRFGKKQSIECNVTLLPGISAFVGGDIASGLYALDICRQTKPVLFLDLGTNGELALWTGKELYVTSTAAGPAFEASELAVTMHAAGVMRVLHICMRTHAIDENGTLASCYFEKGYPVFVTDESKTTVHEKNAQDKVIYLTQEDIRDIQMAKGAIRAGVELLLLRAGMNIDHIRCIYLAGGMGYYIDPEDAKAIGLLPDAYNGPIQAVGNTSLKGAIRMLSEYTQADVKEQLSKITQMGRELVLANEPEFMERYITYMNFPKEKII